MGSWGFLSNHGRVLLFLAHDPGMRLRDIAASLSITERTAFGIITDLVAAGYIRKHKDGRRNHYQIQTHQPLPEPTAANGPSGKSWPCSPTRATWTRTGTRGRRTPLGCPAPPRQDAAAGCLPRLTRIGQTWSTQARRSIQVLDCVHTATASRSPSCRRTRPGRRVGPA